MAAIPAVLAAAVRLQRPRYYSPGWGPSEAPCLACHMGRRHAGGPCAGGCLGLGIFFAPWHLAPAVGRGLPEPVAGGEPRSWLVRARLRLGHRTLRPWGQPAWQALPSVADSATEGSARRVRHPPGTPSHRQHSFQSPLACARAWLCPHTNSNLLTQVAISDCWLPAISLPARLPAILSTCSSRL